MYIYVRMWEAISMRVDMRRTYSIPFCEWMSFCNSVLHRIAVYDGGCSDITTHSNDGIIWCTNCLIVVHYGSQHCIFVDFHWSCDPNSGAVGMLWMPYSVVHNGIIWYPCVRIILATPQAVCNYPCLVGGAIPKIFVNQSTTPNTREIKAV